MNAPSLHDHAADFARLALDNVSREFPYAPQHVMADAGDLALPRELHPAFFGSFDWHSAVHMHWLLVRLRHGCADAVDTEAIDALLASHLSRDALATESAYLREHPSFERPYGWAWLLALAAESGLDVFDGCVEAVEALVVDWLARASHPVRHGTHANSAFACGLLLDAARVLDRPALADAVVGATRPWFLDDRDLPAQWEPSGEDFLSPVLCEADLVRRVVTAEEFAQWLGGALPGLVDGEPSSLLEPVEVADPTDGRIGHLQGLNLSRAAALRSIADALPAGERRPEMLRAAADRHLAAALPALRAGGYSGDHWLATFAALAMAGWPTSPISL